MTPGHRRRHSAPSIFDSPLEVPLETVHEEVPRKAVTLEEHIQMNEEVGSNSSCNTTVGYSEDGCLDQEASRTIQRKIEESGVKEVEAIYRSLKPSLRSLITDIFGNYVVQRLVEIGPLDIVDDITAHILASFMPYATHVYGCRIVQRCLTARPGVVLPLVKLHLIDLVNDANGNHIVQKAIETDPVICEFIVESLGGNIVKFAAHPFGCRIVQRILENAKSAKPILPILQCILMKIHSLIADQYGNYVVQHVLVHGHPEYKKSLTLRLKGHFSLLCTHKYASNVVEKAFEASSSELRNEILLELMQPVPSRPRYQTGFSKAATDQYGNYVAQKIYDLCHAEGKSVIKQHLQPFLIEMQTAPFGRHFAALLSQ